MIDSRYMNELEQKVSALEIKCIRSDQTAEQYHSAFENSREALHLFSREKKFLDVNKRLVQLCQYSRKALLSMSLDTLFPDFSARYEIPNEQAHQNPSPLVFETTLLTRKKDRIPVEFSICPLPCQTDGSLVFQGVIRDMSQTKHLLNKLKNYQEKNIHLSETHNAGISRSTAGPKGRYIEVNQAMVSLLGYSRAELFNMNIYALMVQPSAHIYTTRLTAEKIREKELTLLHKNGTTVVVSYAGKSVRDTQGNPLYTDEIIYDITHKTNIAELQKAEKLQSIGDLAGGIAHNFNNIMTGLYGNIALARLELSTETLAFSYLEKAENSMQEAIKLTKQLLTFAKGGDPLKETTNVEALVRNTAVFNLSSSNIRLEMVSSKDLWPVHADKEQLGQVISNIITNSRQAMESGGILTIRMENSSLLKDNLLTIAKGAYIKITISDDGTGIQQKDLERIFDPYYTTKKNGGGMGLSICYSIVKKHNGHIQVSSQWGSGTIITLYLPAILPAAQKEKAMGSDPKSSGNRARILVMDDEDHIRDITQKMLEKLGYSVTLTTTGEEAVEIYQRALEKESPFHLVIMDLTVPGGMGGKEASKEILKTDPDANIVISSGYSNDPIMSDYQAYGLKGIIPKPYRLAELKKTVDQLLPDS